MDDQQQTGGGSILDRVLQIQKSETLEHFEPLDIIHDLLQQLSQKEADVLRRRFGLGGQAPETLETIGQTYKVTRERVRQIQRWAVERLKKFPKTKNALHGLDALLQNVLEEHGGLMLEDDLLQALHSHTTETEQLRQATLFLLHELLAEKFERVQHADYKPYWKLRFSSLSLLDGTIKEAETIMSAHGRPMSVAEFLTAWGASDFGRTHAELTEPALMSNLSVAKTIDRNPYGEYGLRRWGSVAPKRMNDKILLIMRKHGKPMHFHEITKKINEIGFDHRQAYPPTVHNELILNKEYVLVGRGMYALREWGYKPGVVADVLTAILQEAGHPMSRDELVAAVLKQRFVKRNTIQLALTNRQLFLRQSDGRYVLVPTSPPPAP